MVDKPIIYCAGITEEELIISSDIKSFWEVQFSKEANADIVLAFSQKHIKVQGIDQGFLFDNDLSAVLYAISPLNLSYIEQLFDIKEEQEEMLQLVKKELHENLIELIEAMSKNDVERIKQYAHKMNSKLLVLSIPAFDSCRFIESNAQDAQSNAVQKEYNLLKMYCLIRLWQIQDK